VNVVPLATHSSRALRDTLLAHGWDVEPADAAANGSEPVALHLTGLDEAALEALVRYAGRLGELREAEVEHFHLAARRHDDVGALDVAMDDAALVRLRERVGDLHRGPRVLGLEGDDEVVRLALTPFRFRDVHGGVVVHDLDDLLHDLRSAGNGRIRVVERDPAEDPAAKRDAQNLGIQPVQFNVIGESELQVKEGYLALAIQHGSQTETIPLVQRTDDLEYRLASTIRQLTRAKKPVIGFVAQQRGPDQAFTEMQEQLRHSYEVRNIDLADSTQPGPDGRRRPGGERLA